jgi:hypothetical protein
MNHAAQSRSMGLAVCTSAVVIGSGATAALALPTDNGQGNYMPSRQMVSQSAWQVVNPDPTELNCRMAEQRTS